jgi:nucleotide-binding universal stress UspA family protein
MSTIQINANINLETSPIFGNNMVEQSIKKILVPIDFSPASIVALDYAVAIAKVLGSQITVYHSFTPMADVSLASGNITVEAETEKLMRQFSRQAESLITPYQSISYENKAKFLDIDTLIKVGYIVNDIEELTTTSYDLVILGTKGVSGIDEVVFGTVAGNVANIAKCPVLVIPAKAIFKGINNIVYATELNKNDTIVIDELLEFATAFKASIVCLHINTKAAMAVEELDAMTELQEKYWFTPISQLQFELISGESVLKELHQYIDEQQPDIMIILRQNRSFIENLFHKSISQKMAFHSKVPVLILQDKN